MAVNNYESGSLVTLSAAFTVGTTPTDPSDVILTVTDPDSIVSTYTYLLGQVIRDSTGNFHYNLRVNKTGLWTDSWQGTGTVVAVSTSAVYVKAPCFWTYSCDLPTVKDQVRFLIGDTDSTDPQLQDGEINWLVSQNPGASPYLVAYYAVTNLLSKYGRLVDKSVGDLRIAYSQRGQRYKDLAAALLHQATVQAAAPYAGGISQSDKLGVESDTDRVRPAFKIGMQDFPGSATNPLSSTQQ